MTKKSILLITQMYPTGLSGTSVKTRATVEFLAKKGFAIDICCPHHSSMTMKELDIEHIRVFFVEKNTMSRISLAFALRVLSLSFSMEPFRVKKMFDKRIATLIDVLCESKKYDYVFFDGFSTLLYAKGFHKNYIYIDDEDITDLMKRRYEDEKNPLLKLFFGVEKIKCKQFEKKYLSRMSQIWAISQNSADHLKTSTKTPITLMPTLVAQAKNVFSEKSKDIVFTGLLSWMENVNGIKWFLEHAWKKVLDKKPKTLFYVIGQKADDQFIAYLNSFPNVKYLGFVQDLNTIYEKSAVAVAPLLINCGIKVKVVTYLSYGLPTIALPEAVWGMSESSGVVVAEPEEFSDQLIEMLSNMQLRKKLSVAGYKNIEKNHSRVALDRFFKKVGVL